MVRKLAANLRALEETAEIQRETLETLSRIKEQAQDIEDVGDLTLEDLKRQKYATNNILEETDRIDNALDTTRRLQNKLGRWTLTFGRGGGALKKKKRHSPKRGASPKRGKSPKRTELPNFSKVADEPEFFSGAASVLNETHGDEFKKIAENDKEIDSMLDETATILGRLDMLSSNINSEVDAQNETLDHVENRLEKVNHKQEVANVRARNFLTGKWRKNGDE